MPYEFTLRSVMPASAQEIYEAWLDSLAHSQMTGGEARMSDEIDAEVSAWDGYITGRNLHLVPHERIVQSWRTSKFTEDHEDSVVTLSLEETDEGTLLILVHSNVPDDQTSYEKGGWEANYFKPMKDYFAKRRPPAKRRASAKARPGATAGKSAGSSKAAGRKAAPRRATSTAEQTKGKASPPKPAAAKRASATSAEEKPKAKAKSAAPRARTTAATRGGSKVNGPRAKPAR
jgi:uncharacterized protein YndB with AHSA1/START domain